MGIELVQKRCTKCDELKNMEQFSKGHNQCKTSLNQLKYDSRDRILNEFLDGCIEGGLITADEHYSTLLLIKSCECRFNDCNHNKNSEYYGKVKCDYDSPKEFFEVCMSIKGFFKRWKELADIYKHTQNDKDRPNIDRIDSDLHYTVDNIRPMTSHLNSFLATAEPIIFVLHEREGLKCIVKDMFDSKTDLTNYLEKHYTSVYAKRLVDTALKEYKKYSEGYNVEFEYKDKLYCLQAMLINKQSNYFQARIERMVLQHISYWKAKIHNQAV